VIQRLGEDHVLDRGDVAPGRLDAELLVDGGPRGHATTRDLVGELATDREPHARGLDDGEDVVGADRDVERYLAEPLDLHSLPRARRHSSRHRSRAG
jgi:hypothetical protein